MKTMAESSIPEVARFVEAQEKINRLKEAYPEIFEQFEALKDEYNSSLEAADKAVRSRGVSCGPFSLMNTATKYDPAKLYEEVGRDNFLRFGGVEKTVTVFELDKARFEAAVAAGEIPAAVLSDVKAVTPRYKKPEKIVL
jgi:hypothetical protein